MSLRGATICGTLPLIMLVACTASRTAYKIDELGNPVVTVGHYNLVRVDQAAQVTTLDPNKGVAISQVVAADEMSENLTEAWGRLMEVAGYALGGAAVSAAAGGPTTPAAIAGALLGYTVQKLREKPEDGPGGHEVGVVVTGAQARALSDEIDALTEAFSEYVETVERTCPIGEMPN